MQLNMYVKQVIIMLLLRGKPLFFSCLSAIACLVAETMLKPSIFTTCLVHDFSLFYFLTKLILFLQIYSSKSFELEQYVHHKVVHHNHAVMLRYCTSPCDILCSFHVLGNSETHAGVIQKMHIIFQNKLKHPLSKT